jgi:hypothetical protein
MPNHLTLQLQRSVGPKYQLSNGFTDTDGEVSFAYFSRNTTTPAGSTLLDGTPTTANILNADVIYGPVLKKGSRILFGRLFREALGAGVTLRVGIVGADAKWLASFDASAAGASELAATIALGAGEVLAADVQLIITVGGANPTLAREISGYIAYAKN